MEKKEAEKEAEAGRVLNLGQILKETGDFGRFQWITFLMFSLMLNVLAWSMLTMAYSATIPDWQCIVGSIGQNSTGNWSAANVCSINGTSCDTFVFDDSLKTVVSEWELICDQKWVSQSITTIQMGGLLVGGLSWSHVSDGIGRKPTFFLNVFLLGVLNAVSYFSVNWEMFAAMRFGIGFCCAGFMLSILYFEYIRNKWRVYLFFLPSWALWSTAMAGFTYLVPDWHYIHVVIAGMAALTMPLWFLFPESFRWLAANGRFDEAEKAIKWVARINGMPAPDQARLRAAINVEGSDITDKKSAKIYTVMDLFRTSDIRKTTILFSIVWLFSAFSYYGIAFGVQELSGNLYLNLFLLSVVDIPGDYLTILFNTWGGRRWTCVGMYVVGGLFALVAGIFRSTDMTISNTAFNVLIFASKLFVSAAWDINNIWSAESFPTVVRNIGNGWISSISRVGSMVAPQIITLGKDIPGLLFLVSGTVCVISGGLCVFLAETKGQDLPDMLQKKEPITNNKSHVQIKTVEY